MAGRRKRPKSEIHPSIRDRLGYSTETDEEIYADWKERTSRVCKPCWELKYCPYGPFVEQSPLLPALKEGVEKQTRYFQNCLDTNTVGEVTVLTAEMHEYYSEWANSDQILLSQALSDLQTEIRFQEAEKKESEQEEIDAWQGKDLPPIEKYRVPYDMGERKLIEEKDFPANIWKRLKRDAEAKRKKYLGALKSGSIDNRAPLEHARRAWFKQRIEEFNPDDYPDHIPEVFTDAACNIFGHICPVFFVAEAMTETEEERRIGRRHLSFETMMRIVRRDDYRCQHCKEKLNDFEVEFDHIIPISKGGSSEEHNLRLTCFDCNRDKSDHYDP